MEHKRLRCWMAPRNILPGTEWAAAIIGGIEGSRTFVLVYSANSNASQQVLREVERAVHRGMPIIPLRIESVPMSKNMEYFISASHWLNAADGPTQEHLDLLAKTITSLIEHHQDLETGMPEPVTPEPKRKPYLFAGAVGAALILLVAVLVFFLTRSEASNRPGDGDGNGKRGFSTTIPTTTRVSPTTLPRPMLTNSVGMKFAWIPAGEFMMGALDGDPNADRDEKPRHKVTITRPFYLAIYELDFEQYSAIRKTNPPMTKDQIELTRRVDNVKTDRWPVDMLYTDALSLATTLNDLPAEKFAKRRYRLPTEAEWEYACRAGTSNIFIGADTLTASQANFHFNPKVNDIAHSVNVGSYPPNPWGLFDMLGNAREWCSDWKGEYPSDAQTDPQGPRVGRQRVIRGGSAYLPASDCRASARFRVDPAALKSGRAHAGARLVCIVDQ
jgi:formylglycine-generating enzyme required for sulfatase activity